MKILFFIPCLLFLLTACGQSGPLYLPPGYGQQNLTAHDAGPSGSQNHAQA